jgi:putative transposase
MHLTKQIQVSKDHPMCEYFDDLCKNANNMYNTTNFYIRQYATGLQSFEEMKPLYETQLEVYQYVNILLKSTKFFPKGKWLGYNALDYLFKNLDDPDYYSLPGQVNQLVIKMALADFSSYFESIKMWKKNKSDFSGMPKMPRYKKKGGKTTLKLSNQICKIKNDRFLQFPLTKLRLDAGLGCDPNALKEVRIKPNHIGFTIDIVLEKAFDEEIILEEDHNAKLLAKCRECTTLDERALAIDTGLSNLCAVVNNFGEKPFLISGGPLKSINQMYNKNIAHYRSIAEKCNKLHTTNRIYSITRNRNNRVRDYMHKATTYIANYAKEYNVKIVIIGHNKFQKDEIELGNPNNTQNQTRENQNFVMIPFTMLINQLQYKLNRLGIELLVIEESYTSKASFENMDYIPTYGVDDAKANFTGTRINRGMYKTNGKHAINADINGAYNIMRKAFPLVRQWNRGLVFAPSIIRLNPKHHKKTRIQRTKPNNSSCLAKVRAD